MTRQWIAPLLTALAAGAIAYGIVRSTNCGHAAKSGDRLQDITFLIHELKLTDAQARDIRSLHQSLSVRLNDCCARHCAARARLAQALAADTNSTDQAEAVLKDMCHEYEQSERATLGHIQAVRAVLNAEQRQHFDTLISQCMCQPCNAQGNVCGMDEKSAPRRAAEATVK